MTVTKTITTSYGHRLGNSFKGIIGGIVLIIIGICLLWWNEKRTVYRSRALSTGRGAVVEGAYDTLNSADEGKLVHISGSAKTDSILKDEVFQVSANAFALRRSVQMYQWIEEKEETTKEKLGGSEETTITYTYRKEWSSFRADSSKFEEAGHDNPQMRFTSQEWFTRMATFGAHKLTDSQIHRIGGNAVLSVESIPQIKEAIDALKAADAKAAEAVKSGLEEAAKTQEGVTAQALAVQANKLENGLFGIPELKNYENGFYLGKDPANPEVGDLRISFSCIASPADVSIICQQLKDTFAPYATKTGNLDEMANGIVSADLMFTSAEKSNKLIAWILRFLGFILISAGIRKILDPLATLGAVVPFIGRIIGAGASFIANVLGAVISLVVIAVAWIFYRPVLGIILLVIGAGLIVLLVKKGGSKSNVA